MPAPRSSSRQVFKRRARIPRRPPWFKPEIVRDNAGADIAGAAGNCAAGMAGRAGVVQVRDRRAVAEMVVHHLLGVEGAHEDVAAAHVDHLLHVFAAGVDIAPEDILARHVRAVAREAFDDLVGEFFLEVS